MVKEPKEKRACFHPGCKEQIAYNRILCLAHFYELDWQDQKLVRKIIKLYAGSH